MRNVATLSHLDPELQTWLKEEAARRTKESGVRVHTYQLVNTAIREFRERQDHAETVKEVNHG